MLSQVSILYLPSPQNLLVKKPRSQIWSTLAGSALAGLALAGSALAIIDS